MARKHKRPEESFPIFDNKWQQFAPRLPYIGSMRRIIRRKATVVTVQTWTVTWEEDVPVAAPAPEKTTPALPPADDSASPTDALGAPTDAPNADQPR